MTKEVEKIGSRLSLAGMIWERINRVYPAGLSQSSTVPLYETDFETPLLQMSEEDIKELESLLVETLNARGYPVMVKIDLKSRECVITRK